MPKFDELDNRIIDLLYEQPRTVYRLCQQIFPQDMDKRSKIRYRLTQMMAIGLVECHGKTYQIPQDRAVIGDATLVVNGEQFPLGDVLFLEQPEMYYGIRLNLAKLKANPKK